MAKIFLTGVTGLVGSSFVIALSEERSDVEFVLLVRGGRGRTAYDRVESVIREQCAFDNMPEIADRVLSKVKVIDGDVTTFDPAVLAADPLMKDVTVIFHCAADVNLGKDPTGKTFHINYDGTVNMIKLAKLIDAKEFHYVSTAYVAGKTKGVAPEADPIDHGFNNPYEESKFKAEKLVRACGIPFTVYRPAIITGRRGDGRIRKPLAFYRILEFMAKLKSHRCSKLGISPTEEIDLGIHFGTTVSDRVYFVPIDFVQEAITALFQKPVANKTYHVTGDCPVPTLMIRDAVCNTLRVKKMEIGNNVTSESADDKLMDRFLGDLFPYFSASIIFEQTNIRAALGDDKLDWSCGEKGLEAMMKSFLADFFPNVEWLQEVIKEK